MVVLKFSSKIIDLGTYVSNITINVGYSTTFGKHSAPAHHKVDKPLWKYEPTVGN